LLTTLPKSWICGGVLRALENELIHLMVRCLADGAGIETTTGGRRHDVIVARFEEFLAANPDRRFI
jgi:hypothetical protein